MPMKKAKATKSRGNSKGNKLLEILGYAAVVATLLLFIPTLLSFFRSSAPNQVVSGNDAQSTLLNGDHNSAVNISGNSSQVISTTGDNSPVIIDKMVFSGLPPSCISNEIRSMDLSPDRFSPELDARLLVSEISSNEARISFRFTNRSTQRMNNMRIIYSETSGSGGAALTNSLPSVLEPGSNAIYSVSSVIPIILPSEPQVISIILRADYSKIARDQTNSFSYHYGFSLFSTSLQAGEYQPIGYKSDASSFSDQEIQKMMDVSTKLSAPMGGLLFVANIAQVPTNTFTYFYDNPDRTLSYDPFNKVLFFRSASINNTDILIGQDVPQGDRHLVFAQWSPEGAGLWIDKQGKWVGTNEVQKFITGVNQGEIPLWLVLPSEHPSESK